MSLITYTLTNMKELEETKDKILYMYDDFCMFDFFLYHHPISRPFGASDFIYTPIIDNSSKLVSISAAVL